MSDLTERIAEVLQADFAHLPLSIRDWLSADELAQQIEAELRLIDVADLKVRLKKAATTLDDMYRKALHPTDPGMSRLAGKAEGVRLALSYVHDAERVSDAQS